MFDLSGKTALITGSSRGIGKAIAEQMAVFGANVVVSSRTAADCEKVAQDINESGRGRSGRAAAIACNITHTDELRNLVDQSVAEFGQIDILVCNAAVNVYLGPMTGMTEKALNKAIDANIKSNFFLCQMVLPAMAERKDGAVIVISSIAGFRGSDSLGAYAVTKAADNQLVRNIAVEYGSYNIRANAIAPGLIKTDFSQALWENKEFLNERLAVTPLKRIGEAEEIAGAAVFLASKAGSYMTGQTLVIDGGVLAN